MIARMLGFLAGALLLSLLGKPLAAHALDPGYLELRPLGSAQWQVAFRAPDVAGQPMAIAARLPDTCQPSEMPEVRPDGQGWTARWQVVCPDGLAGGRIAIDGLDATATDVLIRYGLQASSGADQTRRLTPAEPAFVVPQRQGPLGVMDAYFGLGVTHILFGIDHLFFVLGLMLLIRDRWTLLGAVTAFTLAHSLTLGAAALGHLLLPPPPVEAAIALSIVFLAAEVVRAPEGGSSLAQRAPWIVAFAFGLLHGLGFGYALTELGLPPDAVPLALLSFNLGVEVGQIVFVAGVLALVWCGLRLGRATRFPNTGRVGAAYVIGALAAYWTIERVVALVA